MKNCINCNLSKINDMYYSRIRNNGIISYDKTCRECRKQIQKKWSIGNKEKKKETDKIYRENNKERKRENDKNWRTLNKEKKKETDRIYRENNKERIKSWKLENRSKLREYQNIWRQIPKNKIIDNQRSRLHSSLIRKDKKTIDYIYCSGIFLKKWIEWQFNSNMTWDNYGKYWHIDHVIPCSHHELNKDVFKWCNLRPLEASKNLSKNNKIVQHDILIQELKVKFYMQHLQIAGNS